MKHLILASALVLPFAATSALAAGGGEEKAPSKPKCETGLIYDKKTKTCVTAQESNLDVDSLYENVRELAYAGRYDDAQVVLAQMPANDDRTLTYLGFTNRKMGNMDAAMTYYTRALEVNPANILARSYMGQGFVEQGRVTEAVAQLRAIADHGGQGTWAEASLRTAILDGKTSNY
jgi:tetratricopeptide (TPR) repeat protein